MTKLEAYKQKRFKAPKPPRSVSRFWTHEMYIHWIDKMGKWTAPIDIVVSARVASMKVTKK